MEFLSGIRPGVKRLALALIVIGAVYGAWSFGLIKIPGLTSEKSKVVNKAAISKEGVNEKTASGEMLQVPDLNNNTPADLESRAEIRLMNWIWFANAPIFTANGGLNTLKGSLMDKYNLNVRMITNNSVDDMKREILAFIHDYADGNKNTSNGVHLLTVMGDGATSLIAALNKVIEKAYGPEYRIKIVGSTGFSMGEDCVYGPAEWVNNAQAMKGAVLSGVIGDGDYLLLVRWASGDNGVKINPDPDTYDPEAINVVPATENDFLKAAQDAFTGRVVTLKVKDKDGKLTGETVEKGIDGSLTWFPGDKQIAENTGYVRVISTLQYPNQMPCVILGCDKWLKENKQDVINFLSASLTTANQIKNHDEWFRYATELAPRIFCANPSECSESSTDWYKYAKAGGGYMTNKNGVRTLVGGTQIANLADNKKYFGLKGGNNFYKTVWDYFNNEVLLKLNPADFKNTVGKVVSYEDAVDLTYLKLVNVDAGIASKPDYSKNTGTAFANKAYHIEFNSGSSQISSQEALKELEQLYASVNITENAKVLIVGHTDNIGNYDSNITLSQQRANAVKQWLLTRSGNSFPSDRFSIEGKGDTEPVATNATQIGRSKNRRVQITLLQ